MKKAKKINSIFHLYKKKKILKMKKQITTLCILVGLVQSGCQKDYLNTEPQATILSSNFFQSKESAIAAVNAVYDPMQWGNTINYNPEFFFGDLVSDDALKGGSDLGDLAEIEDLVEFKGKSTNPHVAGIWFNCYQGIYRANQVINNVPGIAMDVTLRNRIVGEAKFLRAYYYFYLMRMFGDVPLILKTLAPNEYKQPRVAKTQVFAQIENDLIDAAASLPEKSTYAPEDRGRATKGAANAYLVKAYVFEQKWSLAEPVALTVMNSGQYALDTVYTRIFSKAGENGMESIFEVQHTSKTIVGWANLNEGNMSNVFQSGRSNGFGWGFNTPTKNFVAEFETGDPRLKGTVIMEGDTVTKGQVSDNSQSPTKMWARKYALTQKDKDGMTAGGDGQSNGPSNDRKMRYADLVLMYAEAAAHNGNEAGALKALNGLRKVRREKNTSILPDRTSSGAQLINDIYHERRVELGLEGIRFFDIVRQGRAAAIFNSAAVKADKPQSVFKQGINELFPVPQGDIDLSGGLMTQNPGY
jgi:hypothetical protein